MGIIIFIVFCMIWYVRPFRAQGKENMLPKKYYINTVLISTVPAFVTTIIIQIGFGWIYKKMGMDKNTNILCMFITDFIAAGCCEETVKYFCGKTYLKKLEKPRRTDFVFLMGAAGLGFDIIESITLISSPVAGIVRGVTCGHIMWQYIMGEYLYRAYSANEEGDTEKAKKCKFKAFFYPIMLHGIVDFTISIAMYFSTMMDESSEAVTPESVAFIGFFVLMFAACIISIVWGYSIAMKSAKEVKNNTSNQ